MRASRTLLSLVVLAFSCRPGAETKKPPGTDENAPKAPRGALQLAEPERDGLVFHLSDGKPAAEPVDRAPRAKTVALAVAEIEKILARLPAIAVAPDDRKDFALRDKSLPPPRTGKTVKGEFPPPTPGDAAAPPQAGPLEVLRFQPQGDVPIAPRLSVTFNQPMIAVTAHDDLAKLPKPFQVTPEPPGNWRWVGTKTLVFEPTGRFPMSTEYRVEIPAGTRSAIGGQLDKAVSFGFTTPAVKVINLFPQAGPQKLDPVFFAEFDQKIDPAAILSKLEVKGGGRAFTIRLARPDEVAADETVARLVKGAEHADRVMTFVAEERFPSDTTVSIVFRAGTPSAEGPRVTDKDQPFSIRTYGPMRIVEARCGWNNDCPPLTPWQFRFTNPIDAETFDKSMIRIDPEVKKFRAVASGNWLTIYPLSKGRTRYTATLSSTLPDEFGQTLGSEESREFKVTAAPQALSSAGEGFVVLDPVGAPRFSVFTINHDEVKLHARKVEPSDWPAFVKYMENVQREDRDFTPPGTSIVDTTIATKGEADEIVETRIDLAKVFPDGVGHAVIVIEPTRQPKNRWERRYVRAWISATKIGLTAMVDAGEVRAWATSLADGKPLSDVEVEFVPGTGRATTDKGGLATLGHPTGNHPVLVATRGKDTAILPASTYWWSASNSWAQYSPGESNAWFVFDDRHMYKPGEEVRLKGWVRLVDWREGGDVVGPPRSVDKIRYKVIDSQGNEILKGERPLNVMGGFDAAFTLPKTMNLGWSYVILEGPASYRHSFQVQEFRRPEFEVTTSADGGPHVVGGHAVATVNASYYAGGALPDAEVEWQVSASPGSYAPPNRDDFTFGTWRPWWIDYYDYGGYDYDSSQYQSFSARTSGAGSHHLRIDFDGVRPARPTSLRVEASVMDVNRQAWSDATTLLVHPALHYVGLRSDRPFIPAGEKFRIDAIVTDLDGNAIAGRPIQMKLVLLEWEQVKGEWKQEEKNPVECQKASAADPVRCEFSPKEGGTYRLEAVIVDDEGRKNRSELTLWVAGGKTRPERNVSREAVTLIPDRKEYRAGETAQILVNAPFYPAEGVLTLRRSGIVRAERFSLSGASTTLKVPIEDGFVPNLHVQVDLVGASARLNDAGEPDPKLPKRPAFATGQLNLKVPPYRRTLSMTITPRDAETEPGAETEVTVEVKGPDGEPVGGAEVAIVVVDEAVLSLSGYRLPDPLGVFYPQRPSGAADFHQRDHVVLANPLDALAGAPDDDKDTGVEQEEAGLLRRGDYAAATRAEKAGEGKSVAAPPPPAAKPKESSKNGGDQSDAQTPIAMRANFDALALFAAEVPTDKSGRARVPVKLPDNLTRYRVMAVAAHDTRRFGKGESVITARLPLMVRPSAPRFLNFGDRFELPVVLQNQTAKELTVSIAARSSNAKLTDAAGWRVTVPARDRVEVRFAATTEKPGTARFQFGAVAGKWTDAAEVSLPVWTPATTEAFATYGVIDKGAIVQPVAAPGEVVKQFGGLEITTSSTQLQALTDAVLYLVSYPFECAEQLSSRVMSIAMLKDVLTAFQAEGLPPPAEMLAAVSRDIERLRRTQNHDGGWGFWRRGEDSWPYLTVHVAHAMARAKQKGFDVPSEITTRSRDYLRDIERHIPSYYPPSVRRAIVAYALYARKQQGDLDVAKAKSVLGEVAIDKHGMETLGWLYAVLAGDPSSKEELKKLRRHVSNRAVEEAGTAHFVSSYDDGAHLLLASDRRVDGVILEAMILDDPKNDLIPKVVQGLLAHKKAGRWGNTQENAFVLIALDLYFHTFEKVTPDFVARAWLGDAYAGEHAFKGRTTERHHIDVPMAWIVDRGGKHEDLILQKDGAGRMYYRIGMNYAPASLELKPSDHGFTVERTYEAVDDPGDVRRDEKGVWRVKAGAKVRVRVTMVAPTRRYHVALVDPIPAGLEPMNPALATTGTIPKDPKDQQPSHGWWWWGPWYEHQNMRDERVEAFTSLLWEGVYDYVYVARATTPGTFVVPPPKAEEMYHPETFGRGGTDRVVVE